MKEEFNFAYCNSINCWFCNHDGCSWSKRQTHTCGLDTYNELLKNRGYSMKEYQKYEYCIAVGCNQISIDSSGKPKNKQICKDDCEVYAFHNYLQEQGYKIIKEEEPYLGAVDNILNGAN